MILAFSALVLCAGCQATPFQSFGTKNANVLAPKFGQISNIPASHGSEVESAFDIAAKRGDVQNTDQQVDVFTRALQTERAETLVDVKSDSVRSKPFETPTTETKDDNGKTAQSSVESLKADLLLNHWTRNYELDRWIENDGFSPNVRRDSEGIKRFNNINHLNMSNDERRKKSGQNFEYSDGLLSNWRWYHPEIEAILKIPTAKRLDPAEEFLENKEYSDENYRILRVNAAILMGRSDDPLAKDFLLNEILDAAQTRKLRIPLHCAVVETLGRMEYVSATELLPIVELVKEKHKGSSERPNPLRRSGDDFEIGIRELWVETLVAIAEKIAPWEHPVFLEALHARDAKMRLEAVKLWQHPERYLARYERKNAKRFAQKTNGRDQNKNRPSPELPEEFLDYARSETDLGIRIEIVKTLGHWKEPELFDIVRNDLNAGPALSNTALDALAEAGCREAIPLIKEKLQSGSARNRARAVRALRKLGCLDEVFRLQDDKAWEIRVEIARAIADSPTPQTARLARNYLSDMLQVQEATVDALACWPPENSVPILLEALENIQIATRRQALNALAEYLPDNKKSVTKKYNIAAKPESVEKQRQTLARLFDELIAQGQNIAPVSWREDDSKPARYRNATFEPDDLVLDDVRRCLGELDRPGISSNRRREITDRLIGLGDDLLPAIEYLHEIEHLEIPESVDGVLARIDPLFAALDRLDDDETDTRRRAASELQRWSKTREFSPLAVRKIFACSREEDDPQTLASLLETLENVDGRAARRLALLLIEGQGDSDRFPVPLDFRRRACEILGKHGDGRDLAALTDLLADKHPEIVRKAIDAILDIVATIDPKSNRFAAEERKIVETFRSMLLHEDRSIRVDVAAALYFFEDPAGEEALIRFAHSKDSKVRLHAVRAIGTLDDPAFVPIILPLLDDRGSIRQEALKTLPKLVGKDIGSTPSRDARFDDLTEIERKVARWKDWAETD